ncbi:MAG: helix-turn-helix domain-containing protein [Nodosilinea sp.]
MTHLRSDSNGSVSTGAVVDKKDYRVMHHRFTDVDHFTEQVQSFSKVRINQLSLDSLQSDLWMATFNQVQCAFFRSSCPIFILGDKPKNAIVFSCLLELTGPYLISHSRKLSHHTLAGFNPGLEAQFTVPAQVHFAAVQIKRDLLQQYLNIMDRSDLDERFWANNYIELPETISTIKIYLQQVLHLIKHQPSFFQRGNIKTLLLDDFIPLLINAIPPSPQNCLQQPALIPRAQLVKEAEGYMLAHLDQPITLKDLCQALHSSQRPLFYAFQEIFGVSPMEYLKIQRLQRVHRCLKTATPQTASVREIAEKYGFWSAGHFSRDYKKMFGEPPSETLKRGGLR